MEIDLYTKPKNTREETREHLDTIFYLSNNAKRSVFVHGVNWIGDFICADDAVKTLNFAKDIDNVCISLQGINLSTKKPYLKTSQISNIGCLLLSMEIKTQKAQELDIKLCPNQQEIKDAESEKNSVLLYLEQLDIRPAFQLFTGNSFQSCFFFEPQRISFNNILRENLIFLSSQFNKSINIDTSLAKSCITCLLAGYKNTGEGLTELDTDGRIYRYVRLIENWQHYCNFNAFIELKNYQKKL